MARQSLSVNSVGVTTWCAWNLLSAAELEPEPEPGPGAGAGAGAELELEEPLEGRFENSTMAGMSASRVSGVKHPRSGAGCRCSETADAEEHQSRDARTQTMWRGTASKVGPGRRQRRRRLPLTVNVHAEDSRAIVGQQRCKRSSDDLGSV
jgi:hypothetical protein